MSFKLNSISLDKENKNNKQTNVRMHNKTSPKLAGHVHSLKLFTLSMTKILLTGKTATIIIIFFSMWKCLCTM